MRKSDIPKTIKYLSREKLEEFFLDIMSVEHKKTRALNELEQKYDTVLTMLAEFSPPCEKDGFMDKNADYCSMNCGVDEKIFKKCWDLYITQHVDWENEPDEWVKL